MNPLPQLICTGRFLRCFFLRKRQNPLEVVIEIFRNLIFSAISNKIRVLLQMGFDSLKAEMPPGSHKLLLNFCTILRMSAGPLLLIHSQTASNPFIRLRAFSMPTSAVSAIKPCIPFAPPRLFSIKAAIFDLHLLKFGQRLLKIHIL